MEKFFRKEFGSALASTEVGYAGGDKSSPTYRQVCDGDTGHAEGTDYMHPLPTPPPPSLVSSPIAYHFAGAWAVVKLEFKKDAVDYASLVEFFFRIHDASTVDRQGTPFTA